MSIFFKLITSIPRMMSIIVSVAHSVLRVIQDKLQKCPFLTVMIDETTDVTNQEQVRLIFCQVD